MSGRAPNGSLRYKPGQEARSGPIQALIGSLRFNVRASLNLVADLPKGRGCLLVRIAHGGLELKHAPRSEVLVKHIAPARRYVNCKLSLQEEEHIFKGRP